jgi:hypothetical protein
VLRGLSSTKKVVISELQAEPWTENGQSMQNISLEKQVEHFKISDLEENMLYAKKTGINEIYLWGVEWWYYRKARGDSSYLDLVKLKIKND